MDVPVDLPFLGQLGVPDRKEPFGENGCDDDMDECICEKGADDFVDMEGKSGEVDIVGEGLHGFAEPRRRWDGKWILHGRVGG